MSSTNLWILAIGLILIAINVVASTRLAPHVAAFFARFTHHDHGSKRAM
jgi:hypothetical protein